jgi:hypothetical protein
LIYQSLHVRAETSEIFAIATDNGAV